MAIAKSPKEDAGFNLLKQKTTQLCLHRNFQVVKKRRSKTNITRAKRWRWPLSSPPRRKQVRIYRKQMWVITNTVKLTDGQNEEQLAQECDGEEMKMAKEEAGLDLKRQKTMLSHKNRCETCR